MRRPVRIAKSRPVSDTDTCAASENTPRPSDFDTAAVPEAACRARIRRQQASLPPHLHEPVAALVAVVAQALEYRTACLTGSGGGGRNRIPDWRSRVRTHLATRLRGKLESGADRGYPYLAADLCKAYARFCGPQLWAESTRAVAPVFRAVARGDVYGGQIVYHVDAALLEWDEAPADAAGRPVPPAAPVDPRRPTRAAAPGLSLSHDPLPPEVPQSVAWVCLDCDHLPASPLGAPLYECPHCDHRFNADHAADGQAPEGDPAAAARCPVCLHFGVRIADVSCPHCPGGELEAVEMAVCPECGAEVVPADWAGHWQEHVRARP